MDDGGYNHKISQCLVADGHRCALAAQKQDPALSCIPVGSDGEDDPKPRRQSDNCCYTVTPEPPKSETAGKSQFESRRLFTAMSRQTSWKTWLLPEGLRSKPIFNTTCGFRTQDALISSLPATPASRWVSQ